MVERSRGRLSAVTQAVRSNASVEGAFETLVARGLIPDTWLDVPLRRRAFAARSLCGACEDGQQWANFHGTRRPRRECCFACDHAIDTGPRDRWPARLEDVCALALDPQAIETAERLARELFARMPECPGSDPQVLWRLIDAERAVPLLRQWDRRSRQFLALDELECLAADVRAMVERQRLARGAAAWRVPWPAWMADAPYRAYNDLLTAAMWRAAEQIARPRHEHDDDGDIAAIAAVVREDVFTAISRNDDELLQLARGRNPFEPAVALWRLGVGVQAVSMKTVALVLPCAR